MASFTKGYPNETQLALGAPIEVGNITTATFTTNAYIGWPIGQTILLTGLDGGKDGMYCIKVSNLYESKDDWRVLGGPDIKVGNTP